MKNKLRQYEFKQKGQDEIAGYTMKALGDDADRLCLTEMEFQRILLLEPGKTFTIKDLGAFRRVI